MRWARRWPSSRVRGRVSTPCAAQSDLRRLSRDANSAQVRARRRNGREVAAGSAAGDGAHRLLRRAVDGGELHGGGAGLARPARGEAVGISRSRWIWTVDRSAGRGVDRVPVGPGASRRRRAADFRYMGRSVAAGGVRGVGGGADPADRERGSCQASKGADHRLSAGSGGQDRTVRDGDRRARRGLRHGHGGTRDAGARPIEGCGGAGKPRSTCARCRRRGARATDSRTTEAS